MSRLTHVAGIHLGVECSITDAARSTPVGERPCHGRKARLVDDGGTPARACSMDGPGGSHYFFLTSSRLSRGGAPPGGFGGGLGADLRAATTHCPARALPVPRQNRAPGGPPPARAAYSRFGIAWQAPADVRLALFRGRREDILQSRVRAKRRSAFCKRGQSMSASLQKRPKCCVAAK